VETTPSVLRRGENAENPYINQKKAGAYIISWAGGGKLRKGEKKITGDAKERMSEEEGEPEKGPILANIG